MRKSRLLSFTLLTSLSISTLTACGGESVENLAATCESLRTQMKPFEDIGLLDRKLYYDGDSVATLLGAASRASNKDFIYQSFPFMKDYTIEDIQSSAHKKGLNNFQVQTALQLFAATPNPIVLTEDEKSAIEASKNPYEEIIEPKVLAIIGEPYSDEGCVGLDSANDVDFSFLVDELYDDTQKAAEESVKHLYGILLCERDGKIWGEKCDAEDFEYEFTPSNEPTEEELEILEERRQTAEREAQNPSGPTLNTTITPLQLCGSLGAVVQTENYGELTCKFVWVNKVRALVWMRS